MDTNGCSNKNTEVEYVDEIGNWGAENGKLCVVGYIKCSYSILDLPYPCCSSINPEVVSTKVVSTDEYSDWGFDNGRWYGIGKAKSDFRIHIKKKRTKEGLIINLHSDTNILLMGNCNHSVLFYNNENLILEATVKFLYAMKIIKIINKI